MNRTKPAEQRRRDLLDAGLDVFFDQGIPAATIDAITRQAGVAKGTFYLHFDSKEQLLAALQVDFEATMVARIDSRVARIDGPWVARLDAWLGAALADYAHERALHDVIFHHPAHPAHHAPEPGARSMVDSLADVLSGGVDAGEFDVDDIELTAMLLCGALHRAFDRIWHRHDTLEPDRLHTALRTLFRRAASA